MILHLSIQNFLLIKQANVSFSEKLNIITGETGSGKSMFISAINFVFGGKLNKDIIGKWDEKAEVSCVVFCDEKNKSLNNTISSLDIALDEENKILITRSILQSGKTISKINGKLVTISTLKELKDLFLDMHSQHQHQLLLSQSKHINLLDIFCGEKIQQEKNQLEEVLKDYRKIISDIENLSGDPKERERKLDIIEYQINEIEKADLYVGLDKELNARRELLQKINHITKATKNAYSILSFSQGGSSILDLISELEGELIKLADYDETNELTNKMCDNISIVNDQLNDLKKDLNIYSESLNYHDDELNEVLERLNNIHNICKKYGGSIEKTLDFYNEILEEKEVIINSEEKIIELEKMKKELVNKINSVCKVISIERTVGRENIIKNLEETLKSLGMKDVVFDIDIQRTKEVTYNGYDKVTFLIATNKGETVKPLNKIASGGEMSRVMLGLKNVLAGHYHIDTFIFDEIDTGVSGRTAQMVAEKLKILSKKHQTICITHLPQIASMADNHICISKVSNDKDTRTNIVSLDFDKSVLELSRLLGGVKITEHTQNASIELKKFAEEFDKKL